MQFKFLGHYSDSIPEVPRLHLISLSCTGELHRCAFHRCKIDYLISVTISFFKVLSALIDLSFCEHDLSSSSSDHHYGRADISSR
jgi:hypothetical protein